MLAGVGGRTIAEAKQNLSYVEALDWFAYIKRRGSLHVGMRLEQGFAQLMALVVNRTGGNKGDAVGAADFMVHNDAVGDEPATLQDVTKLLGVKKVKPHAK